jgi:enterochelin esterase-like enzyme
MASGSYPDSSMKHVLALVLIACSATRVHVQQPPPESPEVLPDRRVVFRLLAPEAAQVQLALEGASPVSLTKNAEGIWSVTTAALEPDFYAYSFLIDGVATLDPANSATRVRVARTESVLHVPGSTSLPWEIKPVPRGTLHHHFYRSGIVGGERDFYVYTPPGYADGVERRYPVLYLQHGYGGDASGWLAAPANVILDNLIAEGKAEPMLLVMSNGYGVIDFFQRGRPDLVLSRAQQNSDRFRQALLAEVIPHVERNYRVAPGRESRALAGVSMGGSQALYVGLNAPYPFAWVVSLSTGGASPTFNHETDFPALDARANTQLRLLWIACGTDDPVIGANRAFREWLSSRGVRFTAVETAGAHTWMVWRRNLTAFVPLLFRPSAN